MKKIAIIFFLIFNTISTFVWADSSATWTCTGKQVLLKSITPYMGEDSKFTQTLFILTRLPLNDEENVDTAFFLKIERDLGKYGTFTIRGKNEVGGRFEVKMSSPEDVGDGTVIHMKAKGTLSYFQGPNLTGKNERVSCVLN